MLLPLLCASRHLELHRCVGNSPTHPSLALLALGLGHWEAGKAWLVHTSGLTLPKNVTHSLRFPSLCEHETDRQTDRQAIPFSPQQPQWIQLLQGRAELSRGTLPHLQVLPHLHLHSHHTAPPGLHSSPWHPSPPHLRPSKMIFVLLRISKNWSLHYSPREDAGEMKPPEAESEFSAGLHHHPPPSPPAFPEPQSTPAPLNSWVSWLRLYSMATGMVFHVLGLTSWELVPQRPQIHVPCGICIVHNLMKHRSDLSSAN